MSDAQKRALRTLIQGLVGTTGLVALWQVFAPEGWRLSAEQVAVLGPVLTMVASFAMNWLEDHAVIPAVMKPQPRQWDPEGAETPMPGAEQNPLEPVPTPEPAQENTGWGGPGMDYAEPRRPGAPGGPR